jgi:predicted kinase
MLERTQRFDGIKPGCTRRLLPSRKLRRFVREPRTQPHKLQRLPSAQPAHRLRHTGIDHGPLDVLESTGSRKQIEALFFSIASSLPTQCTICSSGTCDLCYTTNMQKSKLIIVAGLPGSGKSTVAEKLAAELSLPLFSVDPIESSILKSGLKRSFETGLAAYLVAETLADEQLKLGLSVIIDAVNPVKEARAMWRNLTRKHHATLIIIECVLDKELHKQRIESRIRNMHGIPEVTWQDVENRRQEYQPWEEERLVLNTANTPEENVKQALDYITKFHL